MDEIKKMNKQVDCEKKYEKQFKQFFLDSDLKKGYKTYKSTTQNLDKSKEDYVNMKSNFSF